MTFKLITDPDQLYELRQAGLLWWVSEKDGGKCSGIGTTLVRARGEMSREQWHFTEHDNEYPCFGILLEE